MKKFYFPALLTFLFAGCNNLEDAELTKRNSFIRFYEGANSYVAAEAHETEDGGYIIAGTIKIEGDAPQTKAVIIKANSVGGEEVRRLFNGAIAKNIIETSDGYVLVGDSVAYNPHSTALADLENYSSRLMILDKSLTVTADGSYSRKIVQGDQTIHVDFHTSGIALDDNDNFITLGTHKTPGGQEMADITCIHFSSRDTIWRQNFDYINRDYVNTKAVYYDNGSVLWGASISESVNNFTKSYLAIPVIQEKSSFWNNNYFGQNSTQLALELKDLKKAIGGYAAIGTYSETDGSKSNVFFIRIDSKGNFIPSSVRYYDGANNLQSVQPSTSEIEDTGEALTQTKDGAFVLAGTTIDTQTGGKDIWLIKISSLGDIIWSKVLGGRSSETVTSIEETRDGGLLICGTLQDGSSEVGGLSSIFLIKTDSNGDLKD